MQQMVIPTMLVRSISHAALVAAAVVLAGCAVTDPSDVSTGQVQTAGYEPSMRNYVADRGGMPLEVIGDPFPGSGDRFAEIAAQAISNSHFGPAFELYVDPSDAPDGAFRTAIVANPGETVTPANACKTDADGTAVGSGGTLRVIAALCRGDKAITRLTGQAVGVTGPDDPKVARLFRQIGATLYPSRSDQTDKSQDAIWP